MTTVTEATKRLVGGDDEADLRSGNLERICADPVLAQRLARRLAEAARDIAPGREWSMEDLRDVLEVAVRGPRDNSVRVLEGRHFRKRLREQAALAERYGDPFSCVVFTLVRGAEGRHRGLEGVASALGAKLGLWGRQACEAAHSHDGLVDLALSAEHAEVLAAQFEQQREDLAHRRRR